MAERHFRSRLFRKMKQTIKSFAESRCEFGLAVPGIFALRARKICFPISCGPAQSGLCLREPSVPALRRIVFLFARSSPCWATAKCGQVTPLDLIEHGVDDCHVTAGQCQDAGDYQIFAYHSFPFTRLFSHRGRIAAPHSLLKSRHFLHAKHSGKRRRQSSRARRNRRILSCRCANGRAPVRRSFSSPAFHSLGNAPVWQLVQSKFSYSASIWMNGLPFGFNLSKSAPAPCARIV
jgi:hypothetical protein